MKHEQVIKTVATYEAGQVQRYHTHPRLSRQYQSDAEHQWGVLMLLLALHPEASREAILEAVAHDNGERFAGDLPRPVKRKNPQVAEMHRLLEIAMRDERTLIPSQNLSEFEENLVKLCDAIECVMYVSIIDPPILETKAWMDLRNFNIEFAKSIGGEEMAYSVSQIQFNAIDRAGCAE